ncbi:MAG TPA: hypothetical protein VJ024_00330 [Thermodesulfovibrionales bacterium]|nr:hypothetical protein [Thermodesulfovibrionales bacterium]
MIRKVVSEIEEAALPFPFVKRLVKTDETANTVKYRLLMDEELFVQVYVNVENDTVGFVLINSGQRIYGRDAIDGKWHRHTFEDPLGHDFSAEGSKAVTLKYFLTEVQEILVKENLL